MSRIKLFSSIFYVLLALCVVSLAGASEIKKEEKFKVRPNADQGPTKIYVGIYLIDIAAINDADQSFTADMYVSLRWQDPRLAGNGRRVMRVEELGWYPDLMVLNRRAIEKRSEPVVTVSNDGTATYDQRLYGTFSFPMDLRNFPFDKHMVPINVITAGTGPEDVEIIFDDTIVGRRANFSAADWDIGELVTRVGKYYFEPRDEYFNLITFEVEADRHADFYIWRIIAPLVLIVFMSWMVFYIDPSHLEAQVGISATSILTLIAFQFSVGFLLPRISYLTRMDLFIFFSSLLVFLALVEGVTTSGLASGGRKALALKIDLWSRVLFPAAFIAAILVSFVF